MVNLVTLTKVIISHIQCSRSCPVLNLCKCSIILHLLHSRNLLAVLYVLCEAVNLPYLMCYFVSLQGLIELYSLKQKNKEFDLEKFFKKINVSTFYRSFIERGLREIDSEMNEGVKGS